MELPDICHNVYPLKLLSSSSSIHSGNCVDVNSLPSVLSPDHSFLEVLEGAEHNKEEILQAVFDWDYLWKVMEMDTAVHTTFNPSVEWNIKPWGQSKTTIDPSKMLMT